MDRPFTERLLSAPRVKEECYTKKFTILGGLGTEEMRKIINAHTSAFVEETSKLVLEGIPDDQDFYIVEFHPLTQHDYKNGEYGLSWGLYAVKGKYK